MEFLLIPASSSNLIMLCDDQREHDMKCGAGLRSCHGPWSRLGGGTSAIRSWSAEKCEGFKCRKGKAGLSDYVLSDGNS